MNYLNIKHSYNTSRNYNSLYELIVKGIHIVAIVDNHTLDCRDFVRVLRIEEYDIIIGVRGVSFGNVYRFEQKKDSEINLFIKECKRLNLEWLVP